MKHLLTLATISLFSFTLLAQKGTIKGTVRDQQSEFPLIGATVELLGMENATGVITNDKGQFVLEQVPLGRQRIKISYIGFESVVIPNIEVTTGKDVFRPSIYKSPSTNWMRWC